MENKAYGDWRREARFAREKKEIGQVAQLQQEDLRNKLKELGYRDFDACVYKYGAGGANKLVLAAACSCADEWGRPLWCDQNRLIAVLGQVTDKDWSTIYKSCQSYMGSIAAKQDEMLHEVFGQYWKKQKIYGEGEKTMAYNWLLGSSRLNSEAWEQMERVFAQRAKRAEMRERCRDLLPPRDRDDWYEAMESTVELAINGEIEIPESEILTPLEIEVMEEQYTNLLQTYVDSGRDLAKVKMKLPVRAGKVVLESRREGYHSGNDDVERYRLGLKLMYRLATTGRVDFEPIEGAYYRSFVFDLLEQMKQPRRDMDELIEWLVEKEEYDWPHFWLRRGGDAPVRERQTNKGKVMEYEYLSALPRPRYPMRFMFVEDPGRIPEGRIERIELEALVWDGEAREISVENPESFNRTMSEIFGNPRKDENLGERVMHGIVKVMSSSKEELLRTPHPSPIDAGLGHLRKVMAARRKVGIYMKWVDIEEERFFLVTTQHKNLTRR